MARAIWSGSVSFGLVNVPVKLYGATSPKTVRFHQLNSETGARVKQKRVDEGTGDEVQYENIVKGYELAPGRYVRIEPEELDAVAPKQTKAVDIEEFVDLADIDPLAYDHGYVLEPQPGGAKAYRTLRDALLASGKVGIGRIILRSKQQLCCIRPLHGTLMIQTMLMSDEINNVAGMVGELNGEEPTERDVAMAGALIDAMTEEWDHGEFEDTYRNKVLELIERKAAGEEVVVEKVEDEPEATPDLMAAMTASLEAAKAKKASKSKKSEKVPA